MEEGKQHIDDLFREGLGDYQETPGSHVWAALEERLDRKDDEGGAVAPAHSYRWLGVVAVVASVVVLGYLAFTRLTTSGERNTADTGLRIEQGTAAVAEPRTGVLQPGTAENVSAANNTNTTNTDAQNEINKDQAITTSSNAAVNPGTSTVNNDKQVPARSAAVTSGVLQDEIAGIAPPRTTGDDGANNETTTRDSKHAGRTAVTKKNNISISAPALEQQIDNEKTKAAALHTNKENGTVTQKTKTENNKSNAAVATGSTGAGNTAAEHKSTEANPAKSSKESYTYKADSKEQNLANTNSSKGAGKQETVAKGTAPVDTKLATTTAKPANTVTYKQGERKNTGAVNMPAINNKEVKEAQTVLATGKDAEQRKPETAPLKATGRGNIGGQATPANVPASSGNTSSGRLSGKEPETANEPTAMPKADESSIATVNANTAPPAPQESKVAPIVVKEISEGKHEKVQPGARNKVTAATQASNGATGKAEEAKKSSKKSSLVEGGIKLGYEFNFAYGNANKYVVAPYIQYYIAPDVSIMLQPAFKFGKASVGNVAGSSSYYKVVGSSFDSSRTTHPSIPSTSTVSYTYKYSQVYDSFLVGYGVTNQELWDIELPVLVRYNLLPSVAFFVGPTFTYSGKLLQITEDMQTYTGLEQTATHNHGPYSYSSITNIPNGPARASYESVFYHSAKPISELENDRYINGVKSMFTMGYMAGFSFAPVDRLMVDVQFQQRFVSNKKVPVQRFKDVYTQPYMRISVGYRLFGDRRKAFGMVP